VRGDILSRSGKAQRGRDVPVRVSKTHPLFDIEGDDPLEIPELFRLSWVAKAYPPGPGRRGLSEGSANSRASFKPLSARLLCLRIPVKDGKWEAFSSDPSGAPTGSILVVDVAAVRAMCRTIEQQVVSLITEERVQATNGREEVLDTVYGTYQDSISPF
jgi:hypothetical protein